MKKIVVFALSTVLLAGCGSSEKSVTCKYAPSKASEARAILSYDGEKKLTKMSLETTMEVPSYIFEDKGTLKSFKDSMKETVDKYKRDGVDVDLVFSEKEKKADMTIDVAKDALTEDNASDIGFYYTKDVEKAVKKYKAQGFTCGKVE